MPHKIIGGIKPSLPLPWETEESVLYLANARSALFIIADLVAPSTVWMPSYYCPSMLDAFQNHNVKFYSVDENLHANLGSIDSVEGDIVVGIDYFGFPTSHRVIEYARKRKCRTVEDCSHCIFLSDFSCHADFVIFNLRKFFPVPDGAILLCMGDDKLICSLQDHEWFCDNLKAMTKRLRNEKTNWYELSQLAKKDAPVGYYSMSTYTKMTFQQINITEACSKQKRNYVRLLNGLKDICLFKNEPVYAPVGFPIVVENRDELRHNLFDKKIYPPIHWEIDHPLSKKIMTLPCDYRYDVEDMDFILELCK
jgi:hypothetical protein